MLYFYLDTGRNAPIFLTCVDCLKDFREQEYVAHIKVSFLGIIEIALKMKKKTVAILH